MRHIDADKFIAELEQEKTVALEFEDGVAVYEIEHMMNLIGMQPTADVVPKSEVEKIFEEIENTINQWIELYYTITVSTFDSIEQAKARASESVLRAFRDYIAELKKKYTKQSGE